MNNSMLVAQYAHYRHGTSSEEPSSLGYQQLLGKLSLPEVKVLEKELCLIENRYSHWQSVVFSILTKGEWHNPVFATQTFDYLALGMLKRGEIDRAVFCSAMIMKAAKDEPNFKGFDAFTSIELRQDDGSVNMAAYQCIKKTLRCRIKGQDEAVQTMTDEQLNLFFDAMRGKPPSEARLYLVAAADKTHLNLQHALFSRVGFNPLQMVFDQKQRIVPTYTMMQIFIEVVSAGQKPIQLHPVIGPVGNLDILDSLGRSRREVGIPFLKHPLPLVADTYLATPLDFIMHDFYHIWRLSGIPQNHRHAFYALAVEIYRLDEKQVILKNEGEPVREKALLHAFLDAIIDMEFDYRLFEDPECAFIISLNYLLNDTVTRYQTAYLLNTPEVINNQTYDVQIASYKIAETALNSNLFFLLGCILKQCADYFKKELKIDLLKIAQEGGGGKIPMNAAILKGFHSK